MSAFVYKQISSYDLLQVKEYKDLLLEDNQEELKKVLYDLGLDVYHEEFEIISRDHRPLSKKDNIPWFGPIFISAERQDREWLESGYASEEALVESKGDVSLIAELNKMGRQSNFTGSIIDNAKRHKKVIQKEWKESK